MSRSDDHHLDGADGKGREGGASAAELPRQRKTFLAIRRSVCQGRQPKRRALPAAPTCAIVALLLLASMADVGCRSAATGRPTEPVVPLPEINKVAAVWRTSNPPGSPMAGDVWVHPKTGMELVYVPAGEFTLGSSDTEIQAWLKERPGDKPEWFADQQPQCRVRTKAYWVGRTEVTNAQYERFVRQTGHRCPDYWVRVQVPTGMESFPVDELTWDDANAYANWAGLRLPTEVEWEKASRGADGREFPWGGRWDATCCRSLQTITGRSYSSINELVDALGKWERTHDVVREGPAPVGSYPGGASPYGCLDMAGNVSEWCSDWHVDRAYDFYAAQDFETGLVGDYRVFRGASWRYGLPMFFRCAARSPHWPASGRAGYGFRCARDPA